MLNLQKETYLDYLMYESIRDYLTSLDLLNKINNNPNYALEMKPDEIHSRLIPGLTGLFYQDYVCYELTGEHKYLSCAYLKRIKSLNPELEFRFELEFIRAFKNRPDYLTIFPNEQLPNLNN